MYHVERFTRTVDDSVGETHNVHTLRIYHHSNKIIEIDDWRKNRTFWDELVEWCESDFTIDCNLSLCDVYWRFVKVGDKIRFELLNCSDEQKITIYLKAEEFKEAVLEDV